MSRHNHHDTREHEHSTTNHDHNHGHEHGHDHEEGIRTVWLALGALLLTTLIQVVIVFLSGSVALLADTILKPGQSGG